MPSISPAVVFLRRRTQRGPWRATTLYLLLALALGLVVPELQNRGPHVSTLASASVTAILTSVASGMMALTAIVFSIMFLGIDFSTTLYGPRLVREVSRQPLVGHALGVFIGTFTYSILAIRAVDRAGTSGVPTIVAWITLAWLLASVILLLIIVARPQQLILPNVLDQLTAAGTRAVARLYPAPRESEPADRGAPERALLRGAAVTQEVRYEGLVSYLQGVAARPLVEAARRADGLIVVRRTVGDPLSGSVLVADVVGARAPVSSRLMRQGLRVGRARDVRRDPAYTLRLLVDIATRALSPAVNDPSTAVNALDEIEHLLLALGASRFDESLLRDAAGVLRVVYAGAPTWADMLDLALLEIQQYGRDAFQVQRRLGALLRRLLAELPPARRPTVAQLIRRRQIAIQGAFPQTGGEAALEAASNDPQGLGHTLAAP